MSFAGLPVHAQTAYSIISGFVVDAASGQPIAAAHVTCANQSTDEKETVTPDGAGRFTSPLLSPGTYRVTAGAAGFQDRVIDQLELAVAGHLDLRFELWRLSDPWHTAGHRTIVMPRSGAVSPFYGPDIDVSRSDSFLPVPASPSLLEAARSYVVDRHLLADLPLAGRDVYGTLAVEPGVVSGTTTARGLGMSVNGQRPTSTEFLLDGLENNNYLTTGPLLTLGPEAVQEYRLSTANFSAQYGGAAGLVANAITLAGGNRWHGLGFMYLRNELLNAADPQRKAECRQNAPLLCIPRPPLREEESGFQVSGPVWKDRLFSSTWLDVYRYRSAGPPVSVSVPSSGFLDRLAATPAADPARWILNSGLARYPAAGDSARVDLAPPILLDRVSWIERLDYDKGAHRVFARLAHGRSDQPDLFYSPYPAYSMPLVQSGFSAAAGWTWLPRPSLNNEARAAFGSDTLRLERTAGVPQLESEDLTVLPGSPSSYSLRNRGRHIEALENLTLLSGSHTFRAGGNVLDRWISGRLSFGNDGYYLFQTVGAFANLDALGYRVAVDRLSALHSDYQPVDPNRGYRYLQVSGFVQDTVRLSERWTLNAGFRLENFGAIRNTGAMADTIVVLGGGRTLQDRIHDADLRRSLEPAYPGTWNPAVRLGLAYANRSGTTVRAGYGIFYDRPFDNLWTTVAVNGTALALLNASVKGQNGKLPTPVLNGNPDVGVSLQLPRITWVAPDLKAPRIQSAFLGVTHAVTEAVSVEFNMVGSLGRRLITSNVVNRRYTTNDFLSVGRIDAALPDIVYRANQGYSKHGEFSAVVHYRAGRGQLQAAYTRSYTFDNQSDPVAGDFDFGFTGLNPLPLARTASFTEQFDSRPDQAHSDLDQRNNLVFLGTWQLPAGNWRGAGTILRDWQASGIFALRSGLPFSVFGSSGSTTLMNNRANLIDPAHYAIAREAATGGKQLLNPAAFTDSPDGLGSSGRNAFRGPGVFSADLSLSRAIRVSESLRLILRADAYNFLNHPNLGQPDNDIRHATFGVAQYGRRETTGGFPALIPFVESPRSVQLMFRLQF
jgi:hypothetical protein